MLSRLFHRTIGSWLRTSALLGGLAVSLGTYVLFVVALDLLVGDWTLAALVGLPAAYWLNNRRQMALYRLSRRAEYARGICSECHGTGRLERFESTGLVNLNGVENIRRVRYGCNVCYGTGRAPSY